MSEETTRPEKPNQTQTLDSWNQFESRKADHIRWSLDERSQVEKGAGFTAIELVHEALPEIDFEDVHTTVQLFGHELSVPFFVSSMTSGNEQGKKINLTLAEVCTARRWALGCGSQRRELTDPESHKEWIDIRQRHPDLFLLGNLGLSQVIHTPIHKLQSLVDRLNLQGFFVHTNPLQECLQPEGSPQFRGGLEALVRAAEHLTVPVILKETGSGFSESTLRRLIKTGVAAVDVSGLGGTHWGRIEGLRASKTDIRADAFKHFEVWGIPTVECLQTAIRLQPDYQVWASGGVRSGVDGAKALAMGAQMVGIAQPILKAVLNGAESLDRVMRTFEFELRVAMFCTGASSISKLREKMPWRRK